MTRQSRLAGAILNTPLSFKQMQIMELICGGKKYEEIAPLVGMRRRQSVGDEMELIRKLLGARTSEQAVAIYVLRPKAL